MFKKKKKKRTKMTIKQDTLKGELYNSYIK